MAVCVTARTKRSLAVGRLASERAIEIVSDSLLCTTTEYRYGRKGVTHQSQVTTLVFRNTLHRYLLFRVLRNENGAACNNMQTVSRARLVPCLFKLQRVAITPVQDADAGTGLP